VASNLYAGCSEHGRKIILSEADSRMTKITIKTVKI